jgi:putative flippase GtrA
MPLLSAYCFFALAATLANIFLQDISLRIYSGAHSIFISVLAGTLTGLLIKYWLDKRYIFRFKANGMAHDVHTFTLYAGMGIFTTAIFWSFEAVFHFIFGTKEMRYAGAAVGLAIGYIVKYQMDKRFVFKTSPK